MKPVKQLYFIALLPPHALAEQIHSIKEEIAAKYHSRHSLKIPEHITLVPPFHCSDELIEILNAGLKKLCQEEKSFDISLNNFGHFSKSVLFIQASSQPKEALHALESALKRLFFEDFSLTKVPQIEEKFTPHLTIANKDLTKSNFTMGWEEFRNRKFEAKFPVSSIYLLKHVNGIWKTETELPFGN
jgi:2'-5' RNA ligase